MLLAFASGAPPRLPSFLNQPLLRQPPQPSLTSARTSLPLPPWLPSLPSPVSLEAATQRTQAAAPRLTSTPPRHLLLPSPPSPESPEDATPHIPAHARRAISTLLPLCHRPLLPQSPAFPVAATQHTRVAALLLSHLPLPRLHPQAQTPSLSLARPGLSLT